MWRKSSRSAEVGACLQVALVDVIDGIIVGSPLPGTDRPQPAPTVPAPATVDETGMALVIPPANPTDPEDRPASDRGTQSGLPIDDDPPAPGGPLHAPQISEGSVGVPTGATPSGGGRSAIPRANFDNIPTPTASTGSTDAWVTSERELLGAQQSEAGVVEHESVAQVPTDAAEPEQQTVHPPSAVDQPVEAGSGGEGAPRPPVSPSEAETFVADAPAPTTFDVTARPGFGPSGVPSGVGWAQARWARSWGLRFDTAGQGSLYEAVLSASGGSVAVAVGDDRRVLRDAQELRDFLGERMVGAPPSGGMGQWPQAVAGYVSAVEARVAGQADGGPLSPEQLRQIDVQIDGGQAWQQVVASVQRPGHWDQLESLVAPLLVSEYLDLNLLVVDAGGRMTSYGSASGDSWAVVVSTTGTGDAPQWVGVPPATAGPVLGGLSGRQVIWAADAGMRFLGPGRDGTRGEGDFLDALVAAGHASGVPVLFGDAAELRRSLVQRMRRDTERQGTDEWAAISAEYVRGQVRAAGGAGDPGDASRAAVEHDARRWLEQGDAWLDIIADVQDPGRPGGPSALTGGLWPLLVQRYLATGIRVLGADGEVRLYGDGEVTLAEVWGTDPGLAGGSWVGLAPVRSPQAAGAGTRPADVAGGWSRPGPDREPTAAAAYEPAAVSALSVAERPGQVPPGMSTAQVQWARRHGRRFAQTSAGQDLYNAVLQAAGGGFTDGDDVFVANAERLRERLIERIQNEDTDLDLWLVVHTTYAARYRDAWIAEREQAGLGPFDEADDQALTELIDKRIDSGGALGDIINSIADPGFWPELADDLAPFLMNRFGLGVRVVEANGVVNRYGRGRPVYIAPLTPNAYDPDAGGPRQWVGLPQNNTRFATGSRLSAPSLADPLLVRLSQAVDARKDAIPAPAAGDPVLDRLRTARALWLTHGTHDDQTGPASPSGGTGPWTPDSIQATVDQLNASSSQVWADGHGVRAGLGLSFFIALADVLYPAAAGGIRPASINVGDADLAGLPGTGVPATEFVLPPSVSDLIDVVPAGGTAFFIDDRRVLVLIETTRGLRLVALNPGESAYAQVISPTPELVASLNTPVDGLALVVGPDGRTIPASALGDRFVPAVGMVQADELLTEPETSPATAEPSADDLAAGTDAAPVSRQQYQWAREHQARFLDTTPGSNSFFDAVIQAAGGRLTTDDLDAVDAQQLRDALAQHVRDKAAAGGLRDWPLINAAYLFEAEERIVEDFFAHDTTEVDPRALHRQINDHIGTGKAWDFIATGFARAGHWEQITARLAPDLLAERFGLSMVIINTNGRPEHHGDAAGRRLVLARTNTQTGALPDWVAVVPQTTTQDHIADTRPFDDIVIDPTAGGSLARYTPADAPAILNDDQQRTADEKELWIQPTESGADSFYSAVLASAGGGFLVDRDTFVGSPTQLRQTLATLFRDRPDILDRATWQQLQQIAGGVDTEGITDALKNPTDPRGDQLGQHLIGPYLDVELSVIGLDGDLTTHGTGLPITIAPSTDANGRPHWAAFIPRTTHAPQHDLSLPGLPDLTDLDQPPTGTPWTPDHYKLIEPGTQQTEDPWRDSSYSSNEHGDKVYCVSVTVITVPENRG